MKRLNALNHLCSWFALIRTPICALVVYLVIIGLANNALAQSAEGGDDFSFDLGYLLPNQIDGVTDILPVFGGRYAFSLSPTGAIEAGLQNTHALGVDFTTLTADFRAIFPVSTGFDGLFYLGPTLNYYAQKDHSDRQTVYGIEVGVGTMLLVTESLWLRADLKLMGGPGTSLYLLFGVAFRPAQH